MPSAPAPVSPATGSGTGTGLRERLVEAASEITCATGWSDVTMAKLADRVGVSRQTVYNEVGSKPALGQAMVMRELDRFLALVATELDRHDDVVEAIRAASERILVAARDNPLLHAVLSTAQGGTSELLPYLTTQAEPLVEAATTMIAEHVDKRFPDLGLSDEELATGLDTVVRLVLSHVMQPGDTPERTAERIAWISARVLTSAGSALRR